MMELTKEYENIHGAGVFTEEKLYEMKDNEIDSVMMNIRRAGCMVLKRGEIIQNVDFYDNLIRGTIDLTRTIRKRVNRGKKIF
jgi:hypothetical protein